MTLVLIFQANPPENVNKRKITNLGKHLVGTQWARKFKKVQAKKTREMKRINFTDFFSLDIFHFREIDLGTYLISRSFIRSGLFKIFWPGAVR